MKVQLAQINTVVGAVEDNAAQVHQLVRQASDEGIDLVVFPELTLSGYPPQDLLEYPWFVDKNEDTIKALAAATDDRTAAIVGFVARSDRREGKGICNAAALLGSGRLLSRHYKTLLPTYDVFDEGRWFDPAQEVKPAEWHGRRIGITICEDAWNTGIFWQHPYYNENPIEHLAEQTLDFFVNISASPFTLGKRDVKRRIYGDIVRRYGIPLVQVNLVGGNDSLVFDGWSNVFGPDGEIKAQARDFHEDRLTVDMDNLDGPMHPVCKSDMEKLYHTLILGVRDYATKCGFEKVVIGLSGGLDSAVTAAIAAEALGKERVVGVSMPSRYSSEHSKSDARALADNLDIEFHTIAIEKMFNAFTEGLEPFFEGLSPDITEENIQSRCRGVTLMALSNKFGYLVLSTGNKSENAVGYATIYGDMCGGLSVISDVPKTMVYELARHINREREVIPQNTIDKPPSAELRPDQKDSDSLPPYDLLDPIIDAWVQQHKGRDEIVAEGFDPNTVRRVVGMINRSEYKRRQAPPGIKVTSKAFGFGRRMPIAAKF